jgi:hypothetical protein
MYQLATVGALALIMIVLGDVFETIILPRRVARRFRLTRFIYGATWVPWRLLARRIHRPEMRERILGPYGPLSLIGLLITWAVLLIVGFALLQWATGSHLQIAGRQVGFGTELYMSGTTLFTLGLGDVTPTLGFARFITVVESGTGLGLFALVIGYLPVLYQAFSRREASISLLDARAGSPPIALELLRRHCQLDHDGLNRFLQDWERWSAEVLESHISYPVLAYFRSQHENQSWVAALTMIMDACALVMVGIKDIPADSARLTFAIARHAAVDLCQSFFAQPNKQTDRLSSADFVTLKKQLHEMGLYFTDEATAETRLAELRHAYEPFVAALGVRLINDLPAWLPAADAKDDWETSIWEGRIRPIEILS